MKATAETKKSCINEIIQTFHSHAATQANQQTQATSA
jgi:hypothetical protein